MNKTAVLILVLAAYCYFVFANDNELEIKIDKGIVRGTYRTSLKGRRILTFTGIPFAKPPVEDLRFMVCMHIIHTRTSYQLKIYFKILYSLQLSQKPGQVF